MAHSFQVRPVRVQSFALPKQAATVYENNTLACIFCGRLYGVKTLRAARVNKKRKKCVGFAVCSAEVGNTYAAK